MSADEPHPVQMCIISPSVVFGLMLTVVKWNALDTLGFPTWFTACVTAPLCGVHVQHFAYVDWIITIYLNCGGDVWNEVGLIDRVKDLQNTLFHPFSFSFQKYRVDMPGSNSAFIPTINAITTSQDLQWMVQPTVITSMSNPYSRSHPYSHHLTNGPGLLGHNTLTRPGVIRSIGDARGRRKRDEQVRELMMKKKKIFSLESFCNADPWSLNKHWFYFFMPLSSLCIIVILFIVSQEYHPTPVYLLALCFVLIVCAC